MGIPFVVGVGAASSGIGALTPAWPGGYTASTDDIAVTLAETESADVLTPPSGWAAITSQAVTSGVTTKLWAIYKRLVSGDVASSIADVGDHIVAQTAIIRDCAAVGNPWNVTVPGTELVSDTSVSIPGVTTTVKDCLVLFAFAMGNDVALAGGGAVTFTNASLGGVVQKGGLWAINGTGGGFCWGTGTKATAGVVSATTCTAPVAANFKAFIEIAFKGYDARVPARRSLSRRSALARGSYH